MTTDYVQALQDDNKISCEKVGAGNWYFSFPSQAKREADASLQTAQADHDKLDVVVRELRHKLAEKAAQLEQEEAAAMGDGSGQDGREEVMHSKMVLEAEVQTLRTELAAHSDSDPAEFQRRDAECQQFLQDVEQYTDQILELESWIKNAASEDALACCQVGFYGEEWNADEYELRELVSLA